MKRKVCRFLAGTIVAVVGAIPASADTIFCVGARTDVFFSSFSTNEVGIIIAVNRQSNVPDYGEVVVTADNYYGRDPNIISDYWNQLIPSSAILNAGCYIVSISAKPGPPGIEPWICGKTQSAVTVAGASITGRVSFPGQIPTPVGSVHIPDGLSTTPVDVNNGDTPICPPPG